LVERVEGTEKMASISPSPVINRWGLVIALGSIVIRSAKPPTEKATAPGWLAIPIVAGPK
jgi:hypothetical protein